MITPQLPLPVIPVVSTTTTTAAPLGVGTGSNNPADFIDAYNRKDGAASLGQPINAVHSWHWGCAQDFSGGNYQDAIIMQPHCSGTAYAVVGARGAICVTALPATRRWRWAIPAKTHIGGVRAGPRTSTVVHVAGRSWFAATTSELSTRSMAVFSIAGTSTTTRSVGHSASLLQTSTSGEPTLASTSNTARSSGTAQVVFAYLVVHQLLRHHVSPRPPTGQLPSFTRPTPAGAMSSDDLGVATARVLSRLPLVRRARSAPPMLTTTGKPPMAGSTPTPTRPKALWCSTVVMSVSA